MKKFVMMLLSFVMCFIFFYSVVEVVDVYGWVYLGIVNSDIGNGSEIFIESYNL